MKDLLPKRNQNSNKGTFGTVLNVSGSEMYSGAAILSSIAALRAGAGKVILCSSDNTLEAASIKVPELVLMKREEVCFNGIKSVVLGCGLSMNCEAENIFKKVIEEIDDNIPIVIDADGLNILASNYIQLPPKTILTPHPLELSRLICKPLDYVIKDPKKSLEMCVEKYSSIVVLKMHKTLILDRNGKYYENNTGNSALAKAGSGDVLAGIIAGLLAQGTELFDAAELGVYLHGLTGEIASQNLSEYSVLASDLLDFIGKAIIRIQNS